MDKKSILKRYKKKGRIWTSNGRVFNTDYIVDYMTWDKSIFDFRAWPRGINKVEFDKLWDSDFVMSDEDIEQGFYWNSGHFAFCIEKGKQQNIVDKDKIWEAMQIIADYRAIEQAKLQEV